MTDKQFDLDKHIVLEQKKMLLKEELNDYLEKEFNIIMPKNKPLWKIILV